MLRRDFVKNMAVACASLSSVMDAGNVYAQTYRKNSDANSNLNAPGNQDGNSDGGGVRIYKNKLATQTEEENELGPAMKKPSPTLLWVRRGKDEYQLDFMGEKGSKAISWLLRDIRAGKQGVPDLRMLQTLSWMQTWLAINGHHVCFDLLSGLRMPATNSSTEGAAQGSFHLPDKFGIFRAVDFRAKSISSAYIGKLAYLLKQGGVGFYSRDFTHIDTGNLIGKKGTQRVWFNK